MKNTRYCLQLICLLLLIGVVAQPVQAQLLQETDEFSRADSLRGSITEERIWWEVTHYDLDVDIQPADSTIKGSNTITYKVVEPLDGRDMQIDLQEPLEIKRIKQNGSELNFKRDGNVFFVDMPEDLKEGEIYSLSVEYHGQPKVAENAPWDGGFVWEKDSEGHHWIATANQGLGASVWWPNKDHQSAEPDSMTTTITVPKPLANVSNGRLVNTKETDSTTTYSWKVTNPINNYNVSVNAGNYVNFSETFEGKDGTLDLDYWVLEQDLEKAEKQFEQVKPMMRCFEDWFGPYPFYEDSFKLVHTPHLGMEHQSAVAYGNEFQNGYMGRDLSGSGWGEKFDFIIIHESAHEWWGNNITTNDVADMWVHEGFTNYSEGLYVECQFGKEAGAEYVRGLREDIANESPITGTYELNNEGSGDMYNKGGNMLHTIRQIVDDDQTWKEILRGLNEEFRHQTVDADQVERYIIEKSGKDLDDVFDQYLHHADIPTLEYKFETNRFYYRWDADVSQFNMPLKVSFPDREAEFIHPVSNRWKWRRVDPDAEQPLKIDQNFYIKTQDVINSEEVEHDG